ncbi:MAG: hypothetical protein WCQ99_10100 [Pseudomonadota bacterium]
MVRDSVLRRILFIAGFNGWSITICAGISVLGSLLMKNWPGVFISLAITVSGCMELQGRRKLKKDLHEAGAWLKASQLWLLFLIVSYAGYQLWSFDSANMFKDLPRSDQQALQSLVGSNSSMISTMYLTFYIAVIITSFIYQGGLWLYYRSVSLRLFHADRDRP